MFELDETTSIAQGAKIKVIGVGGGGGNAVNTMIRGGLTGVEFINANTDNQALQAALAPVKIQLGHTITKGLGAGANPDVGRRAALEDYNKIAEVLDGCDMVFITAGMGGGTGTGAAPVIAKIAKECGALTVGVVTKPFDFEGKKRRRQAEEGIRYLKESVDSLITIPNQRLLAIAGNQLTIVDTFRRADEVLLNAVQGISDLINHTGLINSDFADVRTIMADRGLALMGTGIGQGEHRAIEAATNAISSPLLEDVCIDGATGLIINITGGSDLTTHEVNEATTLIMEAADEDAEIIFGTVIDDSMRDKVKVTVIATGIGGGKAATTMQGTQAATLATAVQEAEQRQAREAIQVSVPAPSAEALAATTAPMTTPAPAGAAPVETAPVAETPVAAAPAEPVAPPPLPKIIPAVMKEESRNDSVMPGFYPSAASNRATEEQVELFDREEELEMEAAPQLTAAAAPAASAPPAPAKEKPKMSDLERAKQIARNLGVTNLSDDEYDIPTFIRRQQHNSPSTN